MADESFWIKRAQSAEAQLATCKDNIDRIRDKYRDMMANLAAKERADGTIDIDFGRLVQNLSLEHAFELRGAIDEHHRISGAPGEKPRVKISA